MSLLRKSAGHAGRGSRKLVVKTLAIAAATAVAVALAGCSGGAAGGKTELSFFSWDNQQTMKPFVDQFEKENPDITIKFSSAPPVAEYISTLQTRLRSNTAADVFIITAENKTQIMDGGFAKDLSKESFMSNVADAAKATYTKDGKTYGMALSSWGGGILYNEDLLAKVGFTDPPKTWDEFLDLCQKLKDAGITPFYEAADQIPVSISALVGMENAKLGGDMDQQIWDGKTTFAKTWTPAFTAVNELFERGLEDRSVAGLKGDDVNAEFEKGSVAMITTGSWGIGAIRAAAPDLKVNFMAVPGTDGTTYWSGAVSPGYAINAKTKNQAAAEKFLTFLQSKDEVKKYNIATGSIMTTKDYDPTLDPAITAMVPDVRAGKFYLPSVSWPNNQDAISNESVAQFQQMIQGQKTPEQAAAALDDKLKTLLK